MSWLVMTKVYMESGSFSTHTMSADEALDFLIPDELVIDLLKSRAKESNRTFIEMCIKDEQDTSKESKTPE